MPDLLPLSLQRRRPARIRPRLAAIRRALAELGDPQRGFPSTLVVGTNGKGSTAALLASILRAHGLRVGLYTSPHLVCVRERIRVDGEAVSSRQLERHLERLDAFPELTFFETLTAAALLEFAGAAVDCAVLEAGMGGLWDATRVADAAVAGLTNVGTDHRSWLGDDREAIAADKGAALAAASVAVLGPGVDDEIRPWLGCPLALPAAALVRVEATPPGAVVAAWDDVEIELDPPLPGAHQVANLHLALALARVSVGSGPLARLDSEAVRRGVARVRWPGRLSHQVVGGHRVLLDGAHNLEGTAALAAHLDRQPTRPNLLFSCLRDKPAKDMAAVLRPRVGEVAVCPLDDERAMPVADLTEAFPEAAVAPDPLAALARLSDPVLACGSLRLIGELLALAEGSEPW
jgi:dihydrofolate synthase/folylpolyglutamate synthase